MAYVSLLQALESARRNDGGKCPIKKHAPCNVETHKVPCGVRGAVHLWYMWQARARRLNTNPEKPRQKMRPHIVFNQTLALESLVHDALRAHLDLSPETPVTLCADWAFYVGA